jgi:enoyl-CoA hydratase
MAYENLRVEEQDGIVVATFTREKALNALNAATLRELGEIIEGVRSSKTARALILTGAGEKAFVAGADIAEMKGLGEKDAQAFAESGQKTFAQLETLGIPTIAAVNGFALGGGCELAMACDLIYAAPKAKFGQPEVNLGIIPGFGGTQRLTRRVGIMRAKELIFTADLIDAARAKEFGLVLEVIDADKLLEHCKTVAKKIAAKGMLAIAESKKAIEQGADLELTKATQLEAKAFGVLFNSFDRAEGMAAFLEKRPAKFEGR